MILFYLSTSINFKKIHNMGSDRISLLEKVSYKHQVSRESATAFAVTAHGKTFGVAVAHFNLSGSTPIGHIHCNGLDASLVVDRCPPTAFSLDASVFTDPVTGDDAYVYGLGLESTIRSYSASIGSEYLNNVNGAPYSAETIARSNYRFLVGAEQRIGFSGSCVLNGYGIIGMACASLTNTSNAVIVPWEDIWSCIEAKQREGIQFPSNCNITMLAPPTLRNRLETLVFPYVKDSVYLRRLSNWMYNNL